MRLCLAGFLIAYTLLAQARSEWVFVGPDGKLHYKTDPRGNRIMDFSHAGYQGGGVRIPSPAAAVKLTPVAGDNTAQIQAAVEEAAKKAPAAVVLGAGEYEVAGTLTIATSGIVLRGENGAVVRLTGKPHRLLDIRGSDTWATEGAAVPIVDDYVASGTTSFRVDSAAGFH